MLRNLFEEYRFFPQYPDKELHITAQLFGGIIERGLVTSYMALGLALRFVLDALKKPEGSKMYYFGIAALDRFKSRLKEYHKYCEHVRTISHFSEFPPHLMEYVEYGLQSLEPPNKPQGPVLPTNLTAMLAPSTTTSTQIYKNNSSASSTTSSKVSTTSEYFFGNISIPTTIYDQYSYIFEQYKPEEIFIIANSVNVAKRSPLSNFLNFLKEKDIIIHRPKDDLEESTEIEFKNKVSFSTYNQSKGREKKVVFLFGANHSYFENIAKKSNPYFRENKFYVGLTRGKEKTIILNNLEEYEGVKLSKSSDFKEYKLIKSYNKNILNILSKIFVIEVEEVKCPEELVIVKSDLFKTQEELGKTQEELEKTKVALNNQRIQIENQNNINEDLQKQIDDLKKK
ncbi:hypothetical protein FQR65_LT20519 [Abscondita terminalis]|nr:hypothetical protein FQR65_LT20519 [Abscondita terminalis]